MKERLVNNESNVVWMTSYSNVFDVLMLISLDHETCCLQWIITFGYVCTPDLLLVPEDEEVVVHYEARI